MLLSRSYLLCLVFIEGVAVMAAELIGAKLIGPLYGNSLYIWAAVLGITLFSLTLGYYIGGWLSARFQNLILSLGILALIGGGLMLSVMPWLSLSIMTQLVEGDIVYDGVGKVYDPRVAFYEGFQMGFATGVGNQRYFRDRLLSYGKFRYYLAFFLFRIDSRFSLLYFNCMVETLYVIFKSSPFFSIL